MPLKKRDGRGVELGKGLIKRVNLRHLFKPFFLGLIRLLAAEKRA